MLNPRTAFRLVSIRRVFSFSQFAATATFFLGEVFRVRCLFILQFFLSGIGRIAPNVGLVTMQ